ncbi:demethylmenaquinone methyltransferase [Enterococcus saccharolyticus]|uniref:Demethylmenaquinone methyltransferase n=1 Tax=Candidatus Enterococcus willemsii TaxID=1857215 RepID=A0ABQ6Z231_9ENTE|nr:MULTISPECIES: demethylmenaquinone methyltransferase [Enterococcus]KAF1305623.1 bifunctional demethylmenaquinone methyltransferase/2-methoxy-6-polyprenyl-1,4-benzoquinol methylase [Enterococcus sp. CU12B]MCD5000885.1 demethylmenaquinone methyltransferase [Enterococcus saccharolyticus]
MNDSTKEKKVYEVFEKIYDNYDFMNSVISFGQHKHWRKSTMRRMKVKNGDTALDVCCGTGDWTLALAHAVGKRGQVVGLDFSESMLTIAKEKADKRQLKQIEWIKGNAMKLPFKDNSFDYVTIGFGLRNVPDYMAVLKEMYRVTKFGGSVVSLETSQPTLIGWRQLYNFYFQYVMPILATVFVKMYKEYSWLQESAKTFPGKQQLKEKFLEAGFTKVDVKGYVGGAVAMHVGSKM